MLSFKDFISEEPLRTAVKRAVDNIGVHKNKINTAAQQTHDAVKNAKTVGGKIGHAALGLAHGATIHAQGVMHHASDARDVLAAANKPAKKMPVGARSYNTPAPAPKVPHQSAIAKPRKPAGPRKAPIANPDAVRATSQLVKNQSRQDKIRSKQNQDRNKQADRDRKAHEVDIKRRARLTAQAAKH